MNSKVIKPESSSIVSIITGHDFRQTAINQIWRLVNGPVILMLIPLYLTAETQGYWYTFISLAALVIFADMGFTTILLQFSAHEYANLSFNQHRALSGDRHHLEKIASLFRFSVKWSAGMGLLAFPLILTAGFFILDEKQTNVDWVGAWVLYSFASIFVFMNGMVLSFIEGCNSVGDVQKIRFKISFITSISMIVLLLLGADLFALAASLAIGAIASTVIVFHRYKNMLNQLWFLGKGLAHQWNKKILPLLGRYAVSFLSGYLIFSMFTIIAFKYYGVVEAGKVGFSIAIFTAIFGIANIWITVVTPKINMYVSRKEFASLNAIFKKHLIAAIMTYILGIILLFGMVTSLQDVLPVANRIVQNSSLAAIALGWLFQIIINGYAVYLRAFKREPLMVPSLFIAAYITAVTVFTATYLPFEYFFIGFLTSYFWGVPWVWLIFTRFRNGLTDG